MAITYKVVKVQNYWSVKTSTGRHIGAFLNQLQAVKLQKELEAQE